MNKLLYIKKCNFVLCFEKLTILKNENEVVTLQYETPIISNRSVSGSLDIKINKSTDLYNFIDKLNADKIVDKDIEIFNEIFKDELNIIVEKDIDIEFKEPSNCVNCKHSLPFVIDSSPYRSFCMKWLFYIENNYLLCDSFEKEEEK